MTRRGNWGLVEHVAKCAVFLANDDAAYVTGLPMAIDGGYIRLSNHVDVTRLISAYAGGEKS